jgi:hypothetical protein
MNAVVWQSLQPTCRAEGARSSVEGDPAPRAARSSQTQPPLAGWPYTFTQR